MSSGRDCMYKIDKKKYDKKEWIEEVIRSILIQRLKIDEMTSEIAKRIMEY